MSDETEQSDIHGHRHTDYTYTGEPTADLEESWHRYQNNPLDHTEQIHRMPIGREVSLLLHKGINETGNNIPSQGTLTDAWYQRYSGARMYQSLDFSRQKQAIRQLMGHAGERWRQRSAEQSGSAAGVADPEQAALPPGPRPMLALPAGPRATPMPPAPLTPAQRGRRGGEATAARPRPDLASRDRQDHAGATRRALGRGFGNIPLDDDARGVWER